MSDYGMTIYDAYGNIRLSVNHRTMRLAGVLNVSKNSNGNSTITGISGHDPIAFVSTYNNDLSNLIFPHIVTFNGDIVNYEKAPFPSFDTGPSLIWVYVTA